MRQTKCGQSFAPNALAGNVHRSNWGEDLKYRFLPKRLVYLLTAAVLYAPATALMAAPATFVTALPVAQNQALVRFNAQPAIGSGGYANVQFPVNIGYGLTPTWALFATVHQGFAEANGQGTSGGAGDLLFFIRDTLYKVDKPRSTFRIAPLAGLYLPTGNNQARSGGALVPGKLQSGSGTVDPYAGLTSGYNSLHHGAALDATWRYNPATNSGYSPGSQFRADGQVEATLWPLHFPDEGLPKMLVLSLETNYLNSGDAHLDGARTPSSAKTFDEDAILELATLHWEIGGGVQFPVLDTSTSLIREHLGSYFFFEYYLATPNWRHRKGP